jgi:hypothetical protein
MGQRIHAAMSTGFLVTRRSSRDEEQGFEFYLETLSGPSRSRWRASVRLNLLVRFLPAARFAHDPPL